MNLNSVVVNLWRESSRYHESNYCAEFQAMEVGGERR